MIASAVAFGVALAAPGAAASEREIARVVVPSADRPHGEVSVVVRGDIRIVRTVLHSKVLRQVAGRIAGKERAGWPEGRPGRAESDRYVAALGEGVAALPPVPAGAEGDDRKRGYVIEFVHGPGASEVVLGPARVEVGADGRLMPTILDSGRHVLALDPAYVERNQQLIVEDAFGLGQEDARRILANGGSGR